MYLGDCQPGSVAPPGGDAEEEEEIIRCVCNIFRDEGLMIQCEKCEVSQSSVLVTIFSFFLIKRVIIMAIL